MHYDSRLLGHSKLETTALYTRVATNTIREVMSPLDRLAPLKPKKDKPLVNPEATSDRAAAIVAAASDRMKKKK